MADAKRAKNIKARASFLAAGLAFAPLLLGAGQLPTRLYVSTVPPGARVFLDEKSIGKSDGLFVVDPGAHTVRLQLDGYRPEERRVEVPAEKITRVVVQMEKELTGGGSNSAPSIQPPKETFMPGDTVKVTPGPAPVKVEDRVLATVEAGTELTALKVQGEWVQVKVHKNGKDVMGWIHTRHLLVVSAPPARELPMKVADAVAFSPDGCLLVAAGWAEEQKPALRVWDAKSWEVKATVAAGDEETAPDCIAFSADGKTLATMTGKGQMVKLWDTGTWELRKTLKGPANPHAVAFSPTVPLLACGWLDSTIELRDPGTAEVARTLTGPRNGLLFNLAFSADGTMLATGGWEVRLWDPVTGGPRRVLSLEGTAGAERPCVVSLAFSPDGRTLVGGGTGDHGNLRVWSAETGKQLKLLKTDERVGEMIAFCVAFSPDGKTLASRTAPRPAGRDARAIVVSETSVKLWDTRTWRVQREVPGGPIFCGKTHSMSFSPDGRWLALAEQKGVKLSSVRPQAATERRGPQ